MSYPILYESNATDFFSLGLGTLPDAISPLVTEERNGEFVFDMSYPIDGRRADLIKNNRIIKVDAGHLLKDQRFVIKTVTPQMDNSGKTFLMIHAEHVSYLANDLAIKPIVNGLDVNASQALFIWNSNLTTPNQFIVDSDINSKNSFSWSIDKVQNGRQALGGVEGSILDHWHGEYRFDNLHISLLQHRGTTANTLLAYGRNLTTFEQEESILETYTSVYPYALLTPAGSDSESKIYTIDGLIIDSTHAANFPNRKVLPVDFSSQFENVKVGTKPSGDDADKTSTYLSLAQVQSKLKEFAQSYITTNNVGVPKVSIKVSFVDLANTVNYADVAPLEELDLCDEVPIRFSKLGIDTTAKVSRVVWNVLTDSYDSLELGEISATLGDKLTEIEQTANKAQDTADKANIVQVGADGKSTIFRGSDTPIANHVGDLWYKPNGEYMEMYQWDGVTWHFVMSTKDTHDISDKVDQAMQEMADKEKEINGKLESNQIDISQAQKDLEQAKQDTANQLADIRDSVVKDVADAKVQSKEALDKANGVDDKASQALENATEAKETATTVATDMDTVKGEISSKADKSTVDTINQTVSDQGTKITQNANDIKSKASSSDVDKLSGRVSTAETTLLQTAQGLTGKADTTQLNKLSGDLTTLSNNFSTTSAGFNASLSKIDDKVNSNKEETDSALSVAKADIKATADNLSTNYTKTTDEYNYINSQIKESADKINLSVASVSDKVDGLSYDNRNLLLDSTFTKVPGKWNYDYKGITPTHDSYNNLVLTIPNGATKENRIYQALDNISWNDTVTFSFYAYVDSNSKADTVEIGAGGYDSLNYVSVSGGNLKKYSVSFKWGSASSTFTLSVGTYQRQIEGTILHITKVKLEKGTKATDWTPAPEDTDSKIAALQIVDDQIKSTVSNKADTSYVDQKADEISSTVTSVSNKIDNLNVNNRNLAVWHKWQLWGDINSKKYVGTTTQSIELDCDNTAHYQGIRFTVDMKGSSKYVLSFDATLEKGTLQGIGGHTGAFSSASVYIDGKKTDSVWSSGTNTTYKVGDKHHYEIHFISKDEPNNDANVPGFFLQPNRGNDSKNDQVTVLFENIMIQEGDKATGYTLAPEDMATVTALSKVDQKADSISTTVTNNKSDADSKFTNINQTINGIQSTVKNKADSSTVTQLSNQINLKVDTSDYNTAMGNKADKDNLVSQINIDKSGVLIQGKKIMIDGDATIKNAVIKSSMIDTLDANKITTGTLNAANVNIINMNANNITTGTLKGINLSMNLNTGEVLFQRGSIKSTNGKLNISVDDGTMSVTNSINEGIYFKDGKMMLSNSNPFNNQNIAYGLVSYETPWVLNGGLTITGYQGALLTATDKSITESSYNNNHPWFRDTVGNVDFYGGFNNGSGVAVRENDVVIGSARGRVDLSGGSQFTSGGLYEQPHIEVGSSAWNSGGVFNDNKGIGQNVVMYANGIDLAAAGGIAAHARIFDVYGDFSVHGKKNAVVSTSKGDVAIDAYETAEYYFGDIGALNTGKSGCAKVIIDGLFNETVNTSIPYHVFITAYEDSYIWVTDRTTTSFIVHSSKPNIDVSYEIKAKRLGYEGDRLEIQKEYI